MESSTKNPTLADDDITYHIEILETYAYILHGDSCKTIAEALNKELRVPVEEIDIFEYQERMKNKKEDEDAKLIYKHCCC